ncbi:MAG: radical SAM protein [Bdellovibrionaceae bacterium]|nr:radical SAM protein [Bdellovibrionales bacterium]MCB9086164.1 radical SAM protein [Pseudobdellovibrionaceae bacterium]
MYLNIDQIQSIHIEPTSRCNLLCPKCARTYHGAKAPSLPIADLEWGAGIDGLFTEKLSRQLKLVMYCGNYGDPAASPHICRFLEELLSRGVKFQALYSNGSLKSPDWWRHLSGLLKNRGQLIFSIDGLEDTNSLYRVNSNWEKIEENLSAAVGGGCSVRWDFLVFHHNRHQIDDAIALARKLGVKEFNVKRSARYFHEHPLPNYDRTTDVRPEEEARIWDEPIAAQDLRDKKSFERYVRSTSVTCKTKHAEPSIYIDFQGAVWPCCWLPAAQYTVGDDIQKSQFDTLLDRYDPGFNSIIKHHIGEILSHPFFQSDLERFWLPDDRRLFVCGRTCGEAFEFTSMVGHKNSRLISLEDVKFS